jgi:integrase
MPKHTINRIDEVPTSNWIKLITLSKQLNFSKASTVPKLQLWFACVIAIDWLTGKRINEILSLRRNSIILTDTQIRIKFFVGKKRSKGSPLELQPYQKAKTIEHKAVPIILEYLDEYDRQIGDKEGYLFPANTQPEIRRVTTKFINGQQQEEKRSYIYNIPGGYVKEQTARFWLSKVNEQLTEKEQIYFHYGRHNIGIKLAYQGKNDHDIAKILDTTVRTASRYTAHAGGFGTEWTNEIE